MSIPSENPKIVYNSVTLFLPRHFTKWELSDTLSPVITEWLTYTQVCTSPRKYSCKCTTAIWTNDTENWRSLGNETFITAWNAFLVWAQVGKPFSFYRSATDNTAGLSYFQYAVWTGKDSGLNLLIGKARYELSIEFVTEPVVRP